MHNISGSIGLTVNNSENQTSNIKHNVVDFEISNNVDQQPAIMEIVMALGTGQVPRIPMPNLEELEGSLIQFGYTIPHALKFIDAYSSNCGVSFNKIILKF